MSGFMVSVIAVVLVVLIVLAGGAGVRHIFLGRRAAVKVEQDMQEQLSGKNPYAKWI